MPAQMVGSSFASIPAGTIVCFVMDSCVGEVNIMANSVLFCNDLMDGLVDLPAGKTGKKSSIERET